ncbi:DUF4179 domain-containing protein [Bacillus sp. AK031]
MSTVKTDAVILSKIKDRQWNSIIDWFESRKASFYRLGRTYLTSGQGMEEVFYQTIINVHDDIHQLKEDEYFEAWVTSLFAANCKRIFNKGYSEKKDNEETPDLYHALEYLENNDKEVIALRFLKGLTQDEAAHVLQVSGETIKSRMSSGLHHLVEILEGGEFLGGCREYRGTFINYLERTLPRNEKISLEIHIHDCPSCQKELSAFQNVLLILTEDNESIPIPSGLTKDAAAKVKETERFRNKKKKKRNKIGLGAAVLVIFAICTGFATNGFTSIYYSWIGWTQQEDEELIGYLKSGLGEPLDLEDTNGGIKVKIRTAVADDVQTLIYYEIEDLNEDNRYIMGLHEGVAIEEEYKVLNQERHPRYFPPGAAQSEEDIEEKNIFKGKLSLPPIREDSATLKMNVARLMKLVEQPEDVSAGAGFNEIEFKEGDWSFEIPVTKHPSIVHELDQETEIEGVPVKFETLTLAPTATMLEFSYKNFVSDQSKRIEFVNFESIETKKRKAAADLYGGTSFSSSSDGWNTMETSFETVYFEKPKELALHFGAIQLFVEDQKEVDIDLTKGFPQAFEYAGSEISIDRVTIGDPTKVEITTEYTKGRAYENLHMQVITDSDYEMHSIGGMGDGVVVDREGKEYKMGEYPHQFDMNDQPRYFQTKENFELVNDYSDEEVIPKGVKIHGYNTTVYSDEVVELVVD